MSHSATQQYVVMPLALRNFFTMDFLSNFSSFIKLYREVRNNMNKYKAFSFSGVGKYNGEKRLSSNKLQLLHL